MRGPSARSVPYRQPPTLPSAGADTKHVAWRGVRRAVVDTPPGSAGARRASAPGTCEDARVTVPAVAPYDAVLLVSFGGPERPDDVMPFLENVTRGRGVPRDRLLEVAQHYHHFGGKSPINDQNRALIAALRELFDREGPQIPIYWGNRNWH